MSNPLAEVLVLTVQKGFWASPACEIFPNRLVLQPVLRLPGRWGSSRNPLNVLPLFWRGLVYCWLRRPRVVLFGSAPRLAAWFARLKRLRLLPPVRLIAPAALYLPPALHPEFDRLIVFSRGEIPGQSPIASRYVFIPLPAPPAPLPEQSAFDGADPTAEEKFIFSGGGASRDFASLIEAHSGLHARIPNPPPLRIVTFSPRTLAYSHPLPPAVQVSYQLPHPQFLYQMSKATFVVVPLKAGAHPHGHTTVVEALSLGKAVISTRHASVEDYVIEGQTGLLVEPGDVTGYREALWQLLENPPLQRALEQQAQRFAQHLTYPAFAQRLAELCSQVLE